MRALIFSNSLYTIFDPFLWPSVRVRPPDRRRPREGSDFRARGELRSSVRWELGAQCCTRCSAGSLLSRRGGAQGRGGEDTKGLDTLAILLPYKSKRRANSERQSYMCIIIRAPCSTAEVRGCECDGDGERARGEFTHKHTRPRARAQTHILYNIIYVC